MPICNHSSFIFPGKNEPLKLNGFTEKSIGIVFTGRRNLHQWKLDGLSLGKGKQNFSWATNKAGSSIMDEFFPLCVPRWSLSRKQGRFNETLCGNQLKNSMHFVYRMKLERCLEAHDGCVNTVSWNQRGIFYHHCSNFEKFEIQKVLFSGSLLVTGSDDLLLKIINPFESRVVTSIQSGHRSNIFNAKFLSFCDDGRIVSCSGDGQLMLTEVERPDTYGSFRYTCHQVNHSVLSLSLVVFAPYEVWEPCFNAL